jgi:hypothetical protein
MHGPDKEFYDEIVSRVASGVVGRGMYDAAGAWGGTNPFPGTLFVLTHRTVDQPAAETDGMQLRLAVVPDVLHPHASGGDGPR